MKRAFGYIRVSSREQADKGESLTTQRIAIKKYCKEKNWKLIETFADEGISGGTVKKRPALLKLMREAEQNKINFVVIHRLSRFARNVRELLNNQKELLDAGIKLVSIKEKMDFSTAIGRTIFTVLGAIAELERDIIRETSLENRIARAKRLIPTCGSIPFARNYDRKKNEWSLDEDKAALIQNAALEYLNGGSLRDIAHELRTRHKIPMSHSNLLRTFKNRCGDSWTVNFKGQDPIKYEIPPILSDETIKALTERMKFLKTNNRVDVKKYVLNGFIMCGLCGGALPGSTRKHGAVYAHRGEKLVKCKAFSAITARYIENAVFKTIFENTEDIAGFEQAIKTALPDEKLIKSLKEKISSGEKEFKKIEKELDKLVEAVLNETLSNEIIRKRKDELLKLQEKLTDEIENCKIKLSNLPSIEKTKADAEEIRMSLLDYFGSEERLNLMSYDEKRRLLNLLFDGKDEDGKKHGIYIYKGDSPGTWDYEINAKLFAGIRTLKKDEIDSLDFKSPLDDPDFTFPNIFEDEREATRKRRENKTKKYQHNIKNLPEHLQNMQTKRLARQQIFKYRSVSRKS